MNAITRAATEQASATEQVAGAMREVRTRTREIALTFAEQVKNTTQSAADIALIAQEIGTVRRANVEQANLMASLSTLLGPDGNGAATGGPLESS